MLNNLNDDEQTKESKNDARPRRGGRRRYQRRSMSMRNKNFLLKNALIDSATHLEVTER